MSEMAAVATRHEVRAEASPAGRRTFTAVVVSDGKSWSALCRELGIASEGDTTAEAVANVKAAVREALEVAEERGVAAGDPVDDQGLLAFLDTHRSTEPVTGAAFQL